MVGPGQRFYQWWICRFTWLLIQYNYGKTNRNDLSEQTDWGHLFLKWNFQAPHLSLCFSITTEWQLAERDDLYLTLGITLPLSGQNKGCMSVPIDHPIAGVIGCFWSKSMMSLPFWTLFYKINIFLRSSWQNRPHTWCRCMTNSKVTLICFVLFWVVF